MTALNTNGNGSSVISWTNKAWALTACAEHATSTTLKVKWLIRNSILVSAYRQALESGAAPKEWTETVHTAFVGIIDARYRDLFGDKDRHLPVFSVEEIEALPFTDRAIPALLTVLATVQQNGQTHYDLVARLKPLLRTKEIAVLDRLYNEQERAAAIAEFRAKTAEVERQKAQGQMSHSQLKRIARRNPRLQEAALKLQAEQNIQFAEAVRAIYASKEKVRWSRI